MDPIYNPNVGYHSARCIIDRELNPHPMETIDLVPASQHGDSHAIEVEGPTSFEYSNAAPGMAAVTGAQTRSSTNGPNLITYVDPEDTERHNAISVMTSALAPQSHSSGVIENVGVIQSHNAGRRSLPAEEFEANISRLADRLTIQGADRPVVELCSAIFAQGVSLKALKERMTRKECEKHGLRSGMRYRMLLHVVRMMKGRVLMDRHVCRLCRPGGAADYKNHRDALRHLLRDHFGIGFQCTQWSISNSLLDQDNTNTKASSEQTFWTANELNRHVAVKHAVVRNKGYC